MTTPIPAPYRPSQLEKVNTVAGAGATETIPDPTAQAAQTLSRITLDTANCVLTFPAPQAGMSFTVVLVQDATGGRTVTWPATVQWSNGIVPVLSTAGGKRDVFTFLCDDGAHFMALLAGETF